MGIIHSHDTLALYLLEWNKIIDPKGIFIICIGFLKYVLKFKTSLWPNGGLSSPDTHFPSSLPLFFLSWSIRKIQDMKGQSMHDLFFFNTCEGNSYCPSLIWLFYPLFVPLLFLISLSLYLLGLILLTLHILFILRLIYNERSPNFSTQIEFSHVNISLANTFYLFIF